MSGQLLLQSEAGVLRLYWFGELTVEAVRRGLEEVEAVGPHHHGWVDMLAVVRCPLAVRPLFVDVQRALMRRTDRRVWMAGSPKLRAMGTWVAHMVPDDQTRIVTTVAHAETWLAESVSRLEPAKRGIARFLHQDAETDQAAATTRRQPTIGRRVVGRLMQKVMGIAIGFEPAFIQEMVVTHGVTEVKRWMGASVQIMDDVQDHFGDAEGQLLLSFAAVWHGCDFCTSGHLLASDMMRFERGEPLLPLTGVALRQWLHETDAGLLDHVREALADFPDDLARIERQNALRLGATPVDDDDRHLLATLSVWEWITDCSIPAGSPEIVPPLDPRISRDRALQRRYAAATAR